MKILKTVTKIVILLVMTTCVLTGEIYVSANVSTRKPIRVGTLFFEFNDPNLALVRNHLEDIQRKNKDKVEFAFYNAQNNQAVQDATISKLLNEGVDLLLVNLVDKSTASVKKLIDQARQYRIPVVLFNYIEPDTIDIIKSYDKAFVVGTDEAYAGTLQGKLVVDMWNLNKSNIDRNKDNTLQYIMLQASNEVVPMIRTKYALSTINEAGIKTEQLALVNAKWNEELAKGAISSLFLKNGSQIEAIISNNDAMAIGAIEALQKYGYNSGNPSKNILVVGIDAIPKARELIRNGFMSGSVVQNPYLTAEAIYTIGMNLANKVNPLKDTDYKLDKSGVQILLPFEIYKNE